MRASWLHSALLVAVIVSGCVTAFDPTKSYVDPTPHFDSAALGSEIAAYMAQTFPPANSTVVVIPSQQKEGDQHLSTALKSALLQAGFGVADPSTAASETYHRLSYVVTPLNGGALVRLHVDDSVVTRLYTANDKGVLVAVAPFAVMRN